MKHLFQGLTVGAFGLLALFLSLSGATLGANPGSPDWAGVYNATTTDVSLGDGLPGALAVDLHGRLLVSPSSSLVISSVGTQANPVANAYITDAEITNLLIGTVATSTGPVLISVTSTEALLVEGAAGGDVLTVDTTNDQVLVSDVNSASRPGLAFQGDTDTGFFRPTGNQIAVTVGASQSVRFSSAGIRSSDGSAAGPSYSFINDVDTGIWLTNQDVLGFALGGTNRFTASSTDLALVDDYNLSLGTGRDAKLTWETADANANALLMSFPEGDSTNVPVFVVGDASIEGADLGFFNGVTDPQIAVVSDNGASWASFYHTGSIAKINMNDGPFDLNLNGTLQHRIGMAAGEQFGVNLQLADIDFKAQGDTVANLFLVDASEDTVETNGSFYANAGIIVTTTAGITASTTQAQGAGVLTAMINEVATVGTTNDTVTLPPAAAGQSLRIINNGANTLQIFPFIGDDLGAGVDTATTLAAGSNVHYVSYDAVNWETF